MEGGHEDLSNTIDSRVVEMRFDNQQFESGARTSLSTIEKLKEGLKFKGAADGLTEITKASQSVDLSAITDGVDALQTRFSKLGEFANKVWIDICDGALQTGKTLVSALTLDPVRDGLQEYETQINAIQTILSNTRSKGTTLDQVNSALDELNTYADKTIYNFTEMTRNIGTFTAAGVDLDTSTAAIKGIANLAAVSGSNSEQASRAMYQLSQAMASGTVKLQDWNSVVNAGLGGQVFQDSLMETARVHGIAIDEMIKDEGSFRETLSDGWLTTDILTETLSKFTGDLTESQLQAMGYTEEEIKGIIALGQDANDAATKVKTFSQLIDTLKEALGSGWTTSWETIIGTFDESKELFTGISDYLGTVITESAKARNTMLAGWKALGGRTALINGLKSAFHGVLNLIRPIKEGFREIFPEMTAKRLYQITTGFTKMMLAFAKGTSEITGLKSTFKGVFALLDIGKQLFGAFASGVGQLLGLLAPLGNGFLFCTGGIGDLLVRLDQAIKDTDIFNKIVSGIINGLKLAVNAIRKFGQKVSEYIAPIGEKLTPIKGKFKDVIDGIKAHLQSLRQSDLSGVKNFSENISISLQPAVEAFGRIKEGFSEFTRKIQPAVEGFKQTLSGLWAFIKQTVKNIGDALAKGFSNIGFDDVADAFSGVLFGGLLLTIHKFVQAFGELAKGSSSIKKSVTGVLDGVKDSLNAWQSSIKAGYIQKVAISIGILAGSLIALSMADPAKLGAALGAMTAAFAELISAMTILMEIAKDKNGKGMGKFTVLLIGISTAVLILSSAIVKLGNLSWSQLGVASAALGGLVFAIGGLSLALSKMSGVSKRSKGAALDLEKLGKSLNLLGTGAGLVMVAGAIAGLAVSVGIFAAIPTERLAQGILAVSTLITELGLFANFVKTGKGILAAGAAMNLLAGAMIQLSGIIIVLGKIDWQTLVQGLAGMGSALLIMVMALNGLDGVKGRSVDLIGLSAALLLFIPALKSIGSMPLSVIAVGLGAIASSFAVLGVGAKLLSGASVTLMSLSKSIALLGAGALAAGVGMAAFSVGLAGLAASGAAAGVAVTAILTAVAGLLPLLFRKLGEAVLSLADVVIAGAPKIGEAFTVLVHTALQAFIVNIPDIVEGALTLCTTIIETLQSQLPQLIDGFLDILIRMIDGVTARVPELKASLHDLVSAIFGNATNSFGSFTGDDALKLTAAIGGLVGVFGALAAIGAYAKQAAVSVALMVVVLSAVTVMFALLSNIPADDTLKMAESITSVLLALSASFAVINLIPSAAALSGVKALAIVVGGIAALITAAGALKQIPGLSWLIDEGAAMLSQIGAAIGGFAGSIAGAFLENTTSSFPAIGQNLTGFMENARGFIDGAKGLNSHTFDGITALASAIITITGAEIVQGIGAWLVGKQDMSQFAENIKVFAPALKEFSDQTKGVDAASVRSSAEAVKALADMAKELPNEGGIVSWFTGDNLLSKFAEELVLFGPKLKKYSDSVSGIDTGVIEASSNAAKVLSVMAANLPNQGGMVSWFVGDNKLSTFGKELAAFGPLLKEYSDSVAGVDAGVVTASVNAAKVLSAMATNLPNQGGMVTWFVGDNKLSTFGKELTTFGPLLKEYADSVSGIDAGVVTASTNAVKMLSDLASALPNQGGIVGLIKGDNSLSAFGIQLVSFGESLASYYAKIKGIDTEKAEDVIEQMASLSKLSEIDFTSFNDFVESLKGLANTGVSDFVNTFNGSATKVRSAIDGMIKTAVERINGSEGKFKGAGEKSLTSFINGFKSKTSDLDSSVQAVITNLVTILKSKESSLRSEGEAYTKAIATGLTNAKSSVTAAIHEIMKAGLSAAGTYTSQFKDAGRQMANGLANGIKQNTSSAENSAKKLAQAAINAAKKKAQIKSPSRKFAELGMYMSLGMAKGIDRYAGKAEEASAGAGEKAIDAFNRIVGGISAALSDDFDANPTIRPVLDLSGVESGTQYLDRIFGQGRSIGVTSIRGANAAAQYTIPGRYSAQETSGSSMTDERIVTAIDRLGERVDRLGAQVSSMRVVMDTGATVGQLESTIDKRLGVRAGYRERRL